MVSRGATLCLGLLGEGWSTRRRRMSFIPFAKMKTRGTESCRTGFGGEVFFLRGGVR